MAELQSIPTNMALTTAVKLEYGDLAHLAIVMRIMQSAFTSRYGESWNNNQCRSMLSLPGTQLMIASYGEEPCGFSISRKVADEEELLMIAVDPQYQNKGIGLVLLEQLITNAISNNIAAVFLEVRFNNPAQYLYKKLGFEKVGLRPAYYTGEGQEKFDALTYKKSLS
ncbi:ribosomal protein S18-alanine N-acetyltransferase [Parasphingorhabdus sp.]|uniref:ribosomal protein S18-alanine N-acetyltransferase n=1 Tax=Parasphingorhabdus sp. TaxID=2709688 RepID=UPI002F92B99F